MAVIERRRTTFSSLGNSQFRWYWLSGTLAAFVFQMNLLVRGLLVIELNGNFSEVGLVSFAAGCPLFALALFGGAIADRWDKRDIIIASQVIQGISILFIAILILLDVIAFWHLIIAAILNGVMFAINLPSRQAIIPQLVNKDQVMNGVALNSGSQNAMRIVGPAVGGVTAGFLGITESYFLMMLLTVISIILMYGVESSDIVRSASWTALVKDISDDIAKGLQYVGNNSELVGLLLMTVVPVLFGMPYIILLVAFASETLGLEEVKSGLLYSAAGIGALAGSIIMAYLGDFRRKGILLLISAIAFGVSLVALSRLYNFYFPFVILIGVGLSSSIYLIANNSLLLLHSEESMRGRVMGIYTMSIGLLPMAAWPIGIAMDSADSRIVFAICGVIIVVFSVFMLLFRSDLRRL